MTRWFRVYDDILDDPKVQLLTPELFKSWVNILALASRSGGKLPPAHQMAFALRLSAQDMQSKLDELILAGLIDITSDGMEPHNWSKRQWKSDDSSDRVRRHRAKKAAETSGNTKQAVTETECSAHVTVTVTPPDTESDTDTERKDTPLPPLQGADPVELYEAIVANSPKIKANSPDPIAVQQAFEAYNARALVLGLPQASMLTPDRRKRIAARLREWGSDGWSRAMANLDTPFLRGQTERGFRADLDFVCQAKSFGRLHDGGYATVGASHAATRSVPAHAGLTVRERAIAAAQRGLDNASAHWARSNGSS